MTEESSLAWRQAFVSMCKKGKLIHSRCCGFLTWFRKRSAFCRS